MLKPSVQLRLGQHLTMTPQLQQAIRLLQLSTIELQTQIQEALETNPLLEISENETEGAEGNGAAEEHNEAGAEETSYDAKEAVDNIPEDLPVDTGWDAIYDIPTPYSGGEDEGRDLFENQGGGAESLHDHLLWQLNLTPMSDQDRAIATTIIDAVGDDGYLSDSLEALHASLAEELEIEFDEVEAVLHLIQHFDPLGVGSRDITECLMLQLNQLDKDTLWLPEAKALVGRHLDLLGARDYKQLTRRLKITEDDLREVIALIQTLQPRPGDLINPVAAQYIVPDVFVRKREGTWLVELNPDIAPKLRVNSLYANLVKRADSSPDNAYLRDHLQEARWFIKSLQSRNETLLRVATSIVEHQRAFLEYGEEAMKPLVLRDIAERLEMHESTISRVTTQKFMHTPKGIFEFKYFFSSHVGTADGGECSATAIRAMIRKLIEQENRAKPLSDSKIASTLVERGIQVARRTVAKYREAMAIPPSNERKRLA